MNKALIMTPTVNVCGSNVEELLDATLNAHTMLSVAAESLCAMDPHGRDYKNLRDLSIAVIQHEKRKKLVQEVLDEIQVVFDSLIEQRNERNARMAETRNRLGWK